MAKTKSVKFVGPAFVIMLVLTCVFMVVPVANAKSLNYMAHSVGDTVFPLVPVNIPGIEPETTYDWVCNYIPDYDPYHTLREVKPIVSSIYFSLGDTIFPSIPIEIPGINPHETYDWAGGLIFGN